MSWWQMCYETCMLSRVQLNFLAHTQLQERKHILLASMLTLDGVKQMIGSQRSERGSRASVPQRNGGRVDKRIRLESGRLKRPGGSNPSRSASTLNHHSSVLF